MYPASGMPNRITAVTRDGREVSAEVDVPRGHPRSPMTKEDIESKFLGLAGSRLGVKKARDVLRTLWKLEELKEVGEVLGLLSLAEAAKA
jgi:2-methylcitrate dehydratase